MQACFWLWRAGATSSRVCCASFSLLWLLLLWSTGLRAHRISSCGSRALERRLQSCGTQAWLLCRTWDLLRSGTEPMSPTMAGGFLTTEPPEKSSFFFFLALPCVLCGILVPQSGVKPMPPTVEPQSPNHQTARESGLMFFKKSCPRAL